MDGARGERGLPGADGGVGPKGEPGLGGAPGLVGKPGVVGLPVGARDALCPKGRSALALAVLAEALFLL